MVSVKAKRSKGKSEADFISREKETGGLARRRRQWQLSVAPGVASQARRASTHNSPMKLMTAQKMSEIMEMRSIERFSCTIPLLEMYGIRLRNRGGVWDGLFVISLSPFSFFSQFL